jgi:hypothetical protein
MNFKKSALASAITLATFATGAAAFDASSWEVSGFVKNETAALQGSGTFIGQNTTWNETGSRNDSGDVIKFENTAKVFVNGDLTENAALHAELNFVYDTEATPNDYQGHMNYSQNDYLRELYVDTMLGDTEVRVGKQQVVWGTADGIKLLDIINPTDYREFAQNTMEDSRIPVWMIKTDTPMGDSANFQFIVSQAEENKIAGLNESGDQGNPFVMKGVDSITGKVNGFYNIAPAMGDVALFFVQAASGSSTGTGLFTNYSGATVGEFADASGDGADFGGLAECDGNGESANCLYDLANDTGTSVTGAGTFTKGSNNAATNLIDAYDGSTNNTGTSTNWDTSNPNTVFEYMAEASFATFYSFSNMTSEYRVERPSSANFGGRYKASLDNGLNFSVNYFNHYDANPYVDIHYEDQSGNRLTTAYSAISGTDTGGAGSFSTLGGTDGGTCGFTDCSDEAGTVVFLKDSDGSQHLLSESVANIVFTEKHNKVHSLGGAFDYTVDSAELPVVLRGEFLYDKGVMTPIVDRAKLSIGDMEGALTSQEADFFKYVIGADINVLTNMLVSGQFIQIRNLDFVDETTTPVVGGVTSHYSGARYTGDSATLHLSNGLQKARENKEFYSLFLSKPFGPNQLGRWNNIFMFEEGGGKWNRFDVEYSFSDELVGSFELNNYWGDTNTQFGQMEDSSNIQVGLKYLF